MLTFIEHILCTKPYAGHFLHTLWCIHYSRPVRQVFYRRGCWGKATIRLALPVRDGMWDLNPSLSGFISFARSHTALGWSWVNRSQTSFLPRCIPGMCHWDFWAFSWFSCSWSCLRRWPTFSCSWGLKACGYYYYLVTWDMTVRSQKTQGERKCLKVLAPFS